MIQSVQDFYSGQELTEWERLETPYSRLEFMSTARLIEKYFPARGTAIDIGGGPGRYTIELLRRGYQVTLFDLAEAQLKIARQQLNALHLTASQIVQGDARDLSAFGDSTFDAGLLMGPLYHLTDESDRLVVLRGFYRILKPGATGIIAYLNAWGLIQTGVVDFPAKYADPDFLRGMLDEGGIGIWYWSNPRRAQAEIEQAGFTVISYAGAEGCAGGARELVEQLAATNPAAYQNLAQLAVDTSEIAPFRDMTNHLHFVARRPER
jgi:S-adenosylmethionine-dependent methyltransferase